MNLRMVLPIEIAVIGLLGGVYFGYHAVKGPEPAATPDSSSRTASAKPSPTPEVKTTRLVSKKGGFAVGVPEDVKAKKAGPYVAMESADKVLSVVIGPVESGAIPVSSKAFMRGVREAYTKVRVTGSDAPLIDGHKAKVTYGRAQNAKKVEIRFVNIVVKADPRNYAINVFAAGDSDPTFILPRVKAITDTFEITE